MYKYILPFLGGNITNHRTNNRSRPRNQIFAFQLFFYPTITGIVCANNIRPVRPEKVTRVYINDMNQFVRIMLERFYMPVEGIVGRDHCDFILIIFTL